jgi:DNA polymerase-3 subunit epsilon
VTAPHQPRIVQLAAILFEDDATEVASMSVIIKPEGFQIPDEAAGFHGITTEHADKVGVPIKIALNLFIQMQRSAATVAAHNLDFDAAMIASETFRAWGKPFEWPIEKSYCTMRAMIPICKLPGITATSNSRS